VERVREDGMRASFTLATDGRGCVRGVRWSEWEAFLGVWTFRPDGSTFTGALLGRSRPGSNDQGTVVAARRRLGVVSVLAACTRAFNKQ
jgi:hypothetical protein